MLNLQNIIKKHKITVFFFFSEFIIFFNNFTFFFLKKFLKFTKRQKKIIMILSLVCSFIIALSLPPCMLPTLHLNDQCSWSIIYDFGFRSLYSNFGSILCSIHALLLYMCDQSFSYLNLSIFHYQLSPPPFFFSFFWTQYHRFSGNVCGISWL